MAKLCQNPDFYRKMSSAQVSPIQQPGHSPIAVTHKPLIIWSHEMNHQKAERVTYRDGIQQSGSFRFV
jgi:hypothetical protein